MKKTKQIPGNHQPQRHGDTEKDKGGDNPLSGFPAFDFLCVSVSLWLMVLMVFMVFEMEIFRLDSIWARGVARHRKGFVIVAFQAFTSMLT
jgi:hypothetical protein